MDQLQKSYNEYAFLDPSAALDGGEAEVGAMTNVSHIVDCEWQTHKSHFYNLIKRTYADDHKWYFVVFKPFDQQYEKHYSWYQYKGLDACRKYFKKYSCLILTKETEATKTHVNALICTTVPPLDGRNTHKYKLGVSLLSDIGDRLRILDYIVKESLDRQFVLYRDYIYSPK